MRIFTTAATWLFVVEVLLVPLVFCAILIVSMRLQAACDRLESFMHIWSDRLLTPTTLPDLHSDIARVEGHAAGVEDERVRTEHRGN